MRYTLSLEEHCGETRQVAPGICVLGPFHLNLKCNELYWSVRPSTVVHFPDDADTVRSRYNANLQKMAVAERTEAQPTQHRNEVGLAVRQATIKLLAESYRQ